MLIHHYSTLCSSEITFKTDPKNTDYAAEHGASRNFEPWRDEKAEEEDRLARLEEEENNPMKALENRQVDSKREMDILDALQDIRDRNARNERVGQAKADELIEKLGLQEIEDEEARQKRLEEEEDERLVREVFSKVSSKPVVAPLNGNGDDDEASTPPPQTITIKRKAEVLSTGSQESLVLPSLVTAKPHLPAVKKQKTTANVLGIKVVKKKVTV